MKRLPALIGLLTTLGGLLASPEIAGILPAKWAAVVITAGAFIQAVTKAIHRPPAA